MFLNYLIIVKPNIVKICKYINYIIKIQKPLGFRFRFSFVFFGSRNIRSAWIIDRIQPKQKLIFRFSSFWFLVLVK